MQVLAQSYVTLFIILSFLLSFFTAPFLVRFCHKIFNADQTAKRQHSTPTPTGGGIGFSIIAIIFLIPLVFLEYSQYSISIYLLVMFVMAILVALLGIIDDKKDLSPKVRLVFQFLFTLIPLLLLPDIWPGVHPVIEKSVLLIGWMWFLNLYNFMDGIDGYVSLETIFICLVASFIVPLFAPLFLVVAGVMFGFLRVNAPLPRAKLFMGDVGSTFLGYVLGGILYACLTLEGSYAFSFMTLVLLFACDASQTIIKRIIRGEKPLMQAHREHWFARMYDLGFSHRRILAFGFLVNLGLLVIISISYDNALRFISPVIGCAFFTILALYIKKCEKKAGRKLPGFSKKDRYQIKDKNAGIKLDEVGQK